jgi:cysteine desulfurase
MATAPIYLDHHATTPVDPRVFEAMKPYFLEDFGNASSRNHAYGWRADEGVTRARKQVAELIGARAKEIVFTSGATESDNLAIKGAALAARDADPNKRHLVTSTIEHKAVLDSCAALEKQGFAVTYVDPEPSGVVPASRIAEAMRDDTVLVSLMLANNEIGTIQPVAEVGALCRERGVLFHCDAVQGLGRLPFDVAALKVDLASLSAHKMYGPKGVGALFVRRRPKIPLTPLIDGGGHERGLRSGTLNVPGVVGFGEACAIARAEGAAEDARLGALRDRVLARLQEELGHVELNGAPQPRLAHNLNVSFWPVESESLLLALRADVALSSGSACTSATLEPSYVLKAIRVPHDRAHCSIRFGLGRFNTEEDVERATDRIVEEVKGLRERNTTWQAAMRREEERGEQEAEGPA